jgi:hypothetical protein
VIVPEIKKLVVDYVKDSQGIIWLIGVKSFILEQDEIGT